MMTLGDQQRLFTILIAKLIIWAYEQGYQITMGEVLRDPRIAELNAASGAGISNSLHNIKLAADLNLFTKLGNGWAYQTTSASHKPLGDYWKSLHSLCRWGGDFKKPDGNHYSMEWQGRR